MVICIFLGGQRANKVYYGPCETKISTMRRQTVMSRGAILYNGESILDTS